MDPARYARLHELYDGARALERELRAAFVARVRTEDPGLGEELAGLCAALEAAEGASRAPDGRAREILADEAIHQARQRLEGLAPDPAAAGWIPERLGPYRILKSLGQGGMGVVYEAQQDSPRRRVALKMIHPTLGTDERLRSASARLGYTLWMGADRPSPDYSQTKFMLLLSSHLETGHYFNPHAQRIMEAKERGARLAVVDTRLSNTASHAHLWIAPWPGTEAAMGQTQPIVPLSGSVLIQS